MTIALIVAHSMITALGCDASTSCASARAGIYRTQAIESLFFISSVDGEPAPVMVHGMPLITRGFEAAARLERLLTRALTDLRPLMKESMVDKSSIGFYLSLPSPNRNLTGLDLLANDDARAAYAEQAESLDREPIDASFAQNLLTTAAVKAGFTMSPNLRYVSLAGHAGGADCISTAIDDLDCGRISLAIVGGVDSLLDESTLEWLNSTGRLKLSDMPVGLRPGEACALLAIVHPSRSEVTVNPVEISHVGIASEKLTLLSGLTSVGIPLSEVLDAAAQPAGWHDATLAWVVSDLNGETYRANEWGNALVRLRAQHTALANLQLWIPAEYFGDTGSASAIVSVCVALAAFERRYSPTDTVVIASASESQMRSALVLSAAQSERARNRGVYVSA